MCGERIVDDIGHGSGSRAFGAQGVLILGYDFSGNSMVAPRVNDIFLSHVHSLVSAFPLPDCAQRSEPVHGAVLDQSTAAVLEDPYAALDPARW